GGGVLYSIGWIYEKITGIEGMGGGDIKLLAMIGSFTGIKGVIVTLFSGSLLGSIFGLVIILFLGKDRKYPIPYGIFLSFGALIFILFGNDIVSFYLNLR
ncbi:MAG: prepilin peptidase, partial [Candidatus Schekmanbacteria bacterium]